MGTELQNVEPLECLFVADGNIPVQDVWASQSPIQDVWEALKVFHDPDANCLR